MGKFKKLVIYLDQNFISNIVKSLNGTELQEYFTLHEILKAGITRRKFVCAVSLFHLEESVLDSRLEQKIRRYIGSFEQILFKPELVIQINQVVNAAMSFLKLSVFPKIEMWEEAFFANPDNEKESWDISSIPPTASGDYIRATHKRTVEQMNELKRAIRKETVSFNEQLEEELDASIRVFFREPWSSRYISEFFRDYGGILWRDQLKIFKRSNEIRETPLIDIRSRLNAYELIYHNDRSTQPGDSTDIDMLSAFLPYCDIICTDKFMKDLACSQKLDQKYSCNIYSAKKRDITRLIEILEKEL